MTAHGMECVPHQGRGILENFWLLDGHAVWLQARNSTDCHTRDRPLVMLKL